MAKITASSSLVMASTLGNVGTDGNVFVDVSTKFIHLADYIDLVTADGVTIQALYSFLKQEWKDDTRTLGLIQYDYPMVAIHPEQFEFDDGWMPDSATTQNYFRDGGYAIKNIDGSTAEEYFGVISLGDVQTTAGGPGQIYYQTVDNITGTDNIVLTGAANQCVKIYGDGAGHGLDNASAYDSKNYFKIFVREFEMLYNQSSKELIGLQDGTFLTYQAYRFPLSNAADLVVQALGLTKDTEAATYPNIEINYLQGVDFTAFADATVYPVHSVFQDVGDTKANGYDAWYYTALGGTSNSASLATDTGITDEVIYAGEYDIDGTPSPFNIIVDNDTTDVMGTKYTIDELYARIQYDLRTTGNIDASATFVKNGNVTDTLLFFVGPTLNTKTGVMIVDQNSDDTNSIDFYDATAVLRQYPYVATGKLFFNGNLSDDFDSLDPSKVTLFYTYTRRFTSTANASFSATVNNGAGTPDTTTLIMSDVDFSTTGTNGGATPVQVGDFIKVLGMTTVDNNGVFEVTAVTNTTTLAITAYDKNGVLVDEATQTATADTDAFGTPDAIVVLDNLSAPIAGTIINNDPERPFTYNYNNNSDGHKDTAVDAIVTAVALGDNLAQYVKATGVIAKTKTNAITLTAALERNFVS